VDRTIITAPGGLRESRYSIRLNALNFMENCVKPMQVAAGALQLPVLVGIVPSGRLANRPSSAKGKAEDPATLNASRITSTHTRHPASGSPDVGLPTSHLGCKVANQHLRPVREHQLVTYLYGARGQRGSHQRVDKMLAESAKESRFDAGTQHSEESVMRGSIDAERLKQLRGPLRIPCSARRRYTTLI